ncbi:hypothetical protein BCR42DRAFT_439477 [Absidia repens]|uniref:AN1-type domain-containing protein n=1 Tax=Absidia repens TaxID=90262 RepID=A0A1X2IC82_9FUNG|nr:hypothetical protein BCR42DRAFT_439477 [Absidia repens]
METHKNTTSPTTSLLCTAGCGVYGSEQLLGLYSKCYCAGNRGLISSDSKQLASADHNHNKDKLADAPELVETTPTKTSPTTTIHFAPTKMATITATIAKLASTPKVKVSLAKQTINKCRCDYVFCDSHRFPDRHDCGVDYRKIGRELLAKKKKEKYETLVVT